MPHSHSCFICGVSLQEVATTEKAAEDLRRVQEEFAERERALEQQMRSHASALQAVHSRESQLEWNTAAGAQAMVSLQRELDVRANTPALALCSDCHVCIPFATTPFGWREDVCVVWGAGQGAGAAGGV